jgi:ATP-dependent Clp protease ATP-binding subunit ClpX
MSEPLVECSFCHKHKDTVAKLIVGDKVAICNECVSLCSGLLDDPAPTDTTTSPNKRLDAKIIKAHLDQDVIGQHRAKIMLSVAVVNHYKRLARSDGPEVQKANVLMLGPTGSGKTMLARSVAGYLDVPFVIADATSLTEAGYVGDDVESMIGRLLAAAGNDVELCQRGIVFIDEIDKISRKGESASITRDVSGEGVQQALLKLVEGTRCRVTGQGSRKHPQGDMIEIDTTNILFIAGGAFVGLDQIVRNRSRGTSVGFNAQVQTDTDTTVDSVTPDDLVRFGMIPEFVGRFPNWVALQALTELDLYHILTDVRNNLLEQYRWIFQQDSINLEFDDEALAAVVANCMSNKTGARGLHTELERVLLPHMFELATYSGRGLDSVRITADLVNTPRPLDDND